MLERDQEYALAKRWREHGDRAAANLSRVIFVAAKVATSYRGWLPISNHFKGNVGLMQALNPLIPNEVFALPVMRCGGSGLRYRITFCDRGRL